jgi:hypothetical protein
MTRDPKKNGLRLAAMAELERKKILGNRTTIFCFLQKQDAREKKYHGVLVRLESVIIEQIFFELVLGPRFHLYLS